MYKGNIQNLPTRIRKTVHGNKLTRTFLLRIVDKVVCGNNYGQNVTCDLDVIYRYKSAMNQFNLAFWITLKSKLHRQKLQEPLHI